MSVVKIFQSGNSQVVRLPRDFQFPPETQEVGIRREGDRIVLEPLRGQEWPTEFWLAFEGMPEDFERSPSGCTDREPDGLTVQP